MLLCSDLPYSNDANLSSKLFAMPSRIGGRKKTTLLIEVFVEAIFKHSSCKQYWISLQEDETEGWG